MTRRLDFLLIILHLPHAPVSNTFVPQAPHVSVLIEEGILWYVSTIFFYSKTHRMDARASHVIFLFSFLHTTSINAIIEWHGGIQKSSFHMRDNEEYI